MSRRQNNKARNGLMMAVGAVSVFFGARALVNRYKRRAGEQQVPYRIKQPMSGADIPLTGMPADQFPAENFANQSQTMIPQTGMASAPVGVWEVGQENAVGTAPGSEPVFTDQPIAVGGLVGPLIVHLISFDNMMKMLRMRRETSGAASETNVPDVRAGGADAIDSLEAQLPEFDRSALVGGSLQERMVHLMERIREALKNTDYTEDQLFKISDDLRSDACKTLDLIQKDGEDNVTGFDEVKQAYDCQ